MRVDDVCCRLTDGCMTVILTVRVRLSDCSGPSAGPLGSASRTARVRRTDYRLPDRSVCRTAGVRLLDGSRLRRLACTVASRLARRTARCVCRAVPSDSRTHGHRVGFTKQQLVAGRPAPPTPHSDDPARGFELLEYSGDGAARQPRHHGQMRQRGKAVPFIIGALGQRGDHQLLRGCHRQRPGPVPCHTAHRRPPPRRRGATAAGPGAGLSEARYACLADTRPPSARSRWDRPAVRRRFDGRRSHLPMTKT